VLSIELDKKKPSVRAPKGENLQWGRETRIGWIEPLLIGGRAPGTDHVHLASVATPSPSHDLSTIRCPFRLLE
jgi:hypothetical protein